MAIPDYQTCMLPLLQIANEHNELKMRDATEILSESFNLSETEKKRLLPSRNQRIIANRVGWARKYLVETDPSKPPNQVIVIGA